MNHPPNRRVKEPDPETGISGIGRGRAGSAYNPIITENSKKSITSFASRLNALLVEFSDSDLITEWLTRQYFRLEIYSNRRQYE